MEVENLSIVNYLNKRRLLSKEERLLLNEIFKEKDYAEGELVVKKGEICGCIYFVEKGALKTYFCNEENKEIINGIAIENNFCTSVASFINQAPSTENIEALEDTKLIYINFRNFKLLVERHPVYQQIYVKKSWKIISLL